MNLKHQGYSPRIHKSAYVAPTATVCGDVSLGENTRVLFGAVLSAEGGPIKIGSDCIIMENAVIRGTKQHPVRVGHHVLIGPQAYLTGCTIEDEVFLATRATVFNGAQIEKKAEIRINGVVHIKTRIPASTIVPIGWVAVGDPAKILPPNEHDAIWAVQKPLNFPQTVFGIDRPPAGETIMREMTERYSRFLDSHKDDVILGD